MPRRTLTTLAVTALAAGAALVAPASAHAGQSLPTTPVQAAHTFYATLLNVRLYDTADSGRAMAYLPRINTVLGYLADNGNAPTYVDRSSITDKNHNRYDDDAQITFRFSHNSACLNLATGTILDHACGTKKPVNQTPLQQAAKTVDAEARYFVKRYPGDPVSLWSYDSLSWIVGADVVDGVKTTLTDTNRDGFEDDGRVEFSKNGHKVCLTLPRQTKAKSTITFGKCATAKRGLPDDAAKVKAAQAAANVKSDLKNAATIEETAITDNPTRWGFAFTSTYAKPATIGGMKVEVSKGTTLVATVKDNVGYCLKGTSTLAPSKTFWYDSALGGLHDGNTRPKGGAC